MRQASQSPMRRTRARSPSSRRARIRRGVTAIEYALVLSLISIVAVSAAQPVTDALGGMLDEISAGLVE